MARLTDRLPLMGDGSTISLQEILDLFAEQAGSGAAAAGPAGTVQMSDGAGGFVVSSFLDHQTVVGTVTAQLVDDADGQGDAGLSLSSGVLSGPAGTNMMVRGHNDDGANGAGSAILEGGTATTIGAGSAMVAGGEGSATQPGGDATVEGGGDHGAGVGLAHLLNGAGIGAHVAADGTFSTDESINIPAGKTYQIDGTPIGGSLPSGASVLIASAIGVDLNTAGDTAMTMSAFATGKFFVAEYTLVTNASIDIDTAGWGVWSDAAGTGQNYMEDGPYAVGAGREFATNAGANCAPNANTGSEMQSTAPIVNVSTPQGSAATADFYVYGLVFT